MFVQAFGIMCFRIKCTAERMYRGAYVPRCRVLSLIVDCMSLPQGFEMTLTSIGLVGSIMSSSVTAAKRISFAPVRSRS